MNNEEKHIQNARLNDDKLRSEMYRTKYYETLEENIKKFKIFGKNTTKAQNDVIDD